MSAYHAVIAAPFAKIGLRMAGEAVSVLDYLPTHTPEQPPADAVTAQVVAQLQAYFHDPRAPFTVPLRPNGTAFQRCVWEVLCAIPPGMVLTYGELAKRLITSARAIGGACRANPIPILIPCHRVLGQQGLGGYAGAVTGDPLIIKRWLLRHEGVELPASP